jgi:DNA-binding response OmpR family regulator
VAAEVPRAVGITKPFHHPELLARIGAVLGRVARSRDRRVVRYGELAVNTLSREVTVGGITLDLSAKEYQLLTTLATEPERVFTKAELLSTVWGFRAQGRTRTLDSHASRLRQKLRAHSDAGWIANEWGIGYRLCRPR